MAQSAARRSHSPKDVSPILTGRLLMIMCYLVALCPCAPRCGQHSTGPARGDSHCREIVQRNRALRANSAPAPQREDAPRFCFPVWCRGGPLSICVSLAQTSVLPWLESAPALFSAGAVLYMFAGNGNRPCGCWCLAWCLPISKMSRRERPGHDDDECLLLRRLLFVLVGAPLPEVVCLITKIFSGRASKRCEA